MKSNGGNLSTVSDRVVEFVLTRKIKDLENLTVSSIARKLEYYRRLRLPRNIWNQCSQLH